jgi:hypothetical protein
VHTSGIQFLSATSGSISLPSLFLSFPHPFAAFRSSFHWFNILFRYEEVESAAKDYDCLDIQDPSLLALYADASFRMVLYNYYLFIFLFIFFIFILVVYSYIYP